MIPLDSVSHLLDGRRLDNLLGVHEIEVNLPAFECKKVFNIVHNTMDMRVICEDWGGEILIFDNGYITSFLDNIALAAMIGKLDLGNDHSKDIPILIKALTKKFLAEQILVIDNSQIGRVLFLETVIEFDKHLRDLFALKESISILKASSDRFTAMAADFIRNHELGHILSRQDPFLNYPERALQEAQRIPDWEKLAKDRQITILEEIVSDFFGINSVLVLYHKLMSGIHLKNYIKFLVICLIRMHVLYDLAADLHRTNVDPDYRIGDIDGRFIELQAREFVMVNYIEELEFGKETVIPLASDGFLTLDIEHSGVLDVACVNYSDAWNEPSRRIAELVSTGFEPDAGFRTIVEGTRSTRVLDRR